MFRRSDRSHARFAASSIRLVHRAEAKGDERMDSPVRDGLVGSASGTDSVITFGVICSIASAFALIGCPLSGALSNRTILSFLLGSLSILVGIRLLRDGSDALRAFGHPDRERDVACWAALAQSRNSARKRLVVKNSPTAIITAKYSRCSSITGASAPVVRPRTSSTPCHSGSNCTTNWIGCG